MTFFARARPAGHWASINEVSFVAGMRLLFWIHRRLGAWPFRVVLYPVVGWYVLTKPAARAASLQYLRHLDTRPSIAGIKPGMKGVLRHFAAFAEAILDKMLLWGGLFPLDQTIFHGQEAMTTAIAAKRGGVMICSHLGNLELCRVLSRRRAGLKINVLVHTRHAQAFNRMLAQPMRSGAGSDVYFEHFSDAICLPRAGRDQALSDLRRLDHRLRRLVHGEHSARAGGRAAAPPVHLPRLRPGPRSWATRRRPAPSWPRGWRSLSAACPVSATRCCMASATLLRA
jgi:predicted LPLAT superfamily acyltransferase